MGKNEKKFRPSGNSAVQQKHEQLYGRTPGRCTEAKKIPGLSRGSWNKLFGLLAAGQRDPESDGQGEDRNDPRMNVKGYCVDWLHGCHHTHSDKPNPDERTS